jgi:hypothetical protein
MSIIERFKAWAIARHVRNVARARDVAWSAALDAASKEPPHSGAVTTKRRQS